jgi:voltage-gated potassium channel
MEALALNSRAETIEKRFEKPLLIAAVLSIPTTILQFSDVGEPWHTVGDTLNWLIWTAFLAELVAMLVVTPARTGYLLRRPIDLAIVVLTPPFFAGGVQSLRALRLLRLFRLLRLEPLARRVFSMEGVRATASLALLTALAGGAGFAAAEGVSFGNGLYWAVTTMTTVGYSNVAPISTEGKVIAVVVMLVGIGAATLVIGAVAQRFLVGAVEQVEVAEDDILTQVRDISARLSKLEQALQRTLRT